MKRIRVLHCGNSIQNYYLCCQEKIAGFTSRFNSVEGEEWIYIAVRIGTRSVCGARGKIGRMTDYRPDFEEGERYIQYYRLVEVEYCTPFDLIVLKEAHYYWGAKYLQGYKLLDEAAASICNKNFTINKREAIDLSLIEHVNTVKTMNETSNQFYTEDEVEIEDSFLDTLTNNEKVEISSCFQTIRFKNEIDSDRGLEAIVKSYFFEIFEFYQKEKSILISKNRLFNTKGIKCKVNNQSIPGVMCVPDGLLITFNAEDKHLPLKINLIEYECHGESRTRTSDKERYFDGVITSQLMRFANTFSVSTDSSIRERTVEDWVNKILNFVEQNDYYSKVKNSWIKEIYPEKKDTGIDRAFEIELKKAFKYNIKVLLIIDEITMEQKNRLKTMLNNFKLESYCSSVKSNFVEFSCYVVRLEQKIKIFHVEGNYSLSMQEY